MIQLLKYSKKYRKQVILGPVFKFLEAVFELILPLLMADLLDKGLRQNNRPVVINMTLWMIVMSVVGLGCALLCQYYASIASQGFGTELRNALMKKINSFSHQQLNRFGTDTLITRMTSDINQLQLALAMLIRLVVRAPFLSIGSIVMAFYIDPQTGWLFLLILPLFSLILFVIIRWTVPLYKKIQQKLDSMNQLVSQNLSGVRVIRAFARRTTEVAHFTENTDALARVYLRVTNISALLTPATTFVMNLGIIGLLYFGGIQVNTGRLQPGQIVALVNYMNQMLLALIVVSNLVIIFTRAAASAARINEVFASEDTLPQKAAATLPASNGSSLLSFQNVDFRYTDQSGLALRSVSFTITHEKMLGITGPTGSGKTTLTQLIPRFYDCTSGTVTFDGENVADWPLSALRGQIASVPQTAVLFSGTIRENLLWGRPEASDNDLWRALTIAQCADFVQSLPAGLATPILEGGKNFSGGQRQRLTIARALAADSRLLILDDALSALDYQTDLQLRKALREEYTGTVILISQRVRSLQQADKILVMSEGRLAAQGTHQELLASCREYQEIVDAQEEDAHHD